MSVADDVDKLERRIKQLERELDRATERYDSAREDADSFEAQRDEALSQIEQLEEKFDANNARPFRPDVKRIDAGDWSRAMSSCVCDVCGYQFWEHPTVPGFMWMHRICDGRLVKL